MHRRFVRLVLTIALAVWSMPGLESRQDQEGQTPAPTFRARVDLVTVDVVVTDKDGRPVTDLTAADFEIRESGRPQVIQSFRLVETDSGVDDPQARRDILSFDDQRRELARDDNRLFVIFLDDYHVRLGNSLRVREQLAAFLSQLQPHDLVAITTPLLPASALTFSRNHDVMASEVMNFVGRKYDYRPKNALEQRYASDPPAIQERIRNDWVISALRGLCQYMGTIREGRKTILYVSEGLTATLPEGVATTTDRPRIPTRPSNPSNPNSQPTSREFFETASLLGDMQGVFNAASRGNTAIYTLDPRGLAPSEYSVADTVTPGADTRILSESSDNLRTIAGETNGRAIVGRNDPLPDLRQMLQDSSTYYLLTYVSSLAPRDGKFQDIQVRVRRRDVEVRARKGYWALTAEEVERASAPPRPAPNVEVMEALDALSTSIESERRRAVTTWSGSERGPAEKGLVTFVWEASSGDAAGLPSDRVERVAIKAVAVTGETVFEGDVPREAGSTRFAGQVKFEAPAGLVRVRVEASNSAGRRIESNDVSVDVPDYSVARPVISTPSIFRGRTARDLQLVRASAAAAPSVARAFSRFERMLVRFGAYGPGGAVPTLTVKLLNQSGSAITTLPAPARVGDHFEAEIGLATFPPGSYVLEISATVAEETTKTLVAFRVTG